MSVTLMSAVFKCNMPELKTDDGRVVPDTTAKFVLLALADNASDEGEGAYPGVDTLCQKTNFSTATVCNALNALRHNGFTTLEGRSKRDTNNYTISVAKILEFQWLKRKDSSHRNDSVLATETNPSSNHTRTTKQGDILDGMLHFSREHRPELEMRQRFEQALRLSPDWDKHSPRDTWEGFDLWLLEKDRAGQTIEYWARWWMADDFHAKQTIHLTPDKIKKGWLLAFPIGTDNPTPDYIPEPIPERGAPPPDRAEYEATLEKLHAISAARRAADRNGPGPNATP